MSKRYDLVKKKISKSKKHKKYFSVTIKVQRYEQYVLKILMITLIHISQNYKSMSAFY